MKISFIVPVYNVEMYVEECILSIINQNLDDFEIIVINDGSTDKSRDKVINLKNDNIILIDKKNGGLSSARNEGLKVASGEYIIFVDSDDFLIENSMKQLSQELERSKVDILVGNFLWVYENEIKKQYFPHENNKIMSGQEFYKEALKINSYIAIVWRNIYKKEFLLKNNLNFEDGLLHEDELFTVLALNKAETLESFNVEFYGYRQRAGSITKSSKNIKYYEDILKICEVLYSLKWKDAEVKKFHISNLIGIIIEYMAEFKLKKFPDIFYKLKKENLTLRCSLKCFLIDINSKLFWYLRKS